MNNKLAFLFITIIAIISNSCKKENMGDCFKTTGKVVLESRYLEAFDAIDLDDRINLYITYSSELKIEVEAGENLQNFIKTEVKSGLLKIENNNRCNWVRSYKKDINVYLSTPSLKNIS